MDEPDLFLALAIDFLSAVIKFTGYANLSEKQFLKNLQGSYNSFSASQI